jgi:ribulose-phosphate 3-epimerase
MEHRIKLAPSILSADFGRVGEQVAEATRAGADYIHVDVMDGHFVPNITIGPLVVAAIRPHTSLPLDVHLMIESPEKYIQQFAQAGADIITVHVEVCHHLHRVVESIKELQFIESTIGKIERLRRRLDELGLPAELEVDGGITADIAPRVARAGARVLVAGAAIFNKKESVSQAITRIRESLQRLETG